MVARRGAPRLDRSTQRSNRGWRLPGPSIRGEASRRHRVGRPSECAASLPRRPNASRTVLAVVPQRTGTTSCSWGTCSLRGTIRFRIRAMLQHRPQLRLVLSFWKAEAHADFSPAPHCGARVCDPRGPTRAGVELGARSLASDCNEPVAPNPPAKSEVRLGRLCRPADHGRPHHLFPKSAVRQCW